MQPWLFFDADCGFCRRCLGWIVAPLRRRGWAIAALQHEASGRVLGKSLAARLVALHVRDRQGRVLAGAAACAKVGDDLPPLSPIAFLIRLPVLNRLAEAGYAWIAAQRRCGPDGCPLPRR